LPLNEGKVSPGYPNLPFSIAGLDAYRRFFEFVRLDNVDTRAVSIKKKNISRGVMETYKS
jgi:hypothetical protein